MKVILLLALSGSAMAWTPLSPLPFGRVKPLSSSQASEFLSDEQRRDELFDQGKEIGSSKGANPFGFIFSSKERLQQAGEEGDVLKAGQKKLTHNNAYIVKGTYHSVNSDSITEGILKEEKIPVIMSFATVGDDIQAPGLCAKFFFEGITYDLVTAASVSESVTWDEPMSNVLPPTKNFTEKVITCKFSIAANTQALSVEHLGRDTNGPLQKIDLEIQEPLTERFNRENPGDFSKLARAEFSKSEIFQDQIAVRVDHEIVGVIVLEGKAKANEYIRFVHKFIDKK